MIQWEEALTFLQALRKKPNVGNNLLPSLMEIETINSRNYLRYLMEVFKPRNHGRCVGQGDMLTSGHFNTSSNHPRNKTSRGRL